jgi:hypothetical protein
MFTSLLVRKIEIKINGGIKMQKVNKSIKPIIINTQKKLKKNVIRLSFN